MATGLRTIAAPDLAALLRTAPPGRGPAYHRLAASLRSLVTGGEVHLHARVPAERDLARELGLSRTTVSAAYGLLRDTGHLHSRRGAGSWTALPDAGALPARPAPDGCLDLTAAAPGIPPAELAGAYGRIAPRIAEAAAGSGYQPLGLTALRTALADRYTRRGLPTRPDQILVTTGAQQALTLALELLCAPGDRVLVEEPTYPGALAAVRRARLRPVALPLGDAGWDPAALEDAVRRGAPRLAHLVPHFHSPLGCLMPAEAAARVLDATRRAGTWLVVDETLTDLALDTAVPPPFASTPSAGTADHVLTVGSLSKSHWAGLRTGWLRATPALVAEASALRMAHDLGGPVVDQLLAVELLAQWEDRRPARTARLREQRAALAGALRLHLPQWRWQQPAGGLALWADLGQPVSSVLARRAAGHGVRVAGGGRFGVDPGRFERRLRLPYTLEPELLAEAVRRLAEAYRDGAEPTEGTGWVT